MRIAIIHFSRRKTGGAESYLENVIPALVAYGHEVGFWHTVDEPSEPSRISLPDRVSVWSASELGTVRALRALHDWQPDIIYHHGLQDIKLEALVMQVAPVVFFLHGYQGACISGAKSFKLPVREPCGRRFGWPCLLYYYPRRCGGLNPKTMWVDFKKQFPQLALLRACKAVVTSSSHMAEEYRQYGISVHHVALPVISGAIPPNTSRPQTPIGWNLLFLGRLHTVKGGDLLIAAGAHVVARLHVPIRITFAGEGPEHIALERLAAQTQSWCPLLKVEFVGHVNSVGRDQLISASDLLVFPSTWPEPFGLSGPEAGLHGIPAAAFAVGGVTDWLVDGVSGHLAPAVPPTAEGLADAIVKCLIDPEHYEKLRAGAFKISRKFGMAQHIFELNKVFRSVLPESTFEESGKARV